MYSDISEAEEEVPPPPSRPHPTIIGALLNIQCPEPLIKFQATHGDVSPEQIRLVTVNDRKMVDRLKEDVRTGATVNSDKSRQLVK